MTDSRDDGTARRQGSVQRKTLVYVQSETVGGANGCREGGISAISLVFSTTCKDHNVEKGAARKNATLHAETALAKSQVSVDKRFPISML